MMAVRMEKASQALFLGVSGILALLLLIVCRYLRDSRRKNLTVSGRTLALLAMICFCIIWMRSGLTRSDWKHIWLALFPALFLITCFLPCYLRAEGSRLKWLTPAVSILCLSAAYTMSPGAPTALASIPLLPSWESSPLNAIRSIEIRGARLEINHPTLIEATAVAAALPGNSLYVFPYEIALNAITGKRLMNHTLQSYAASTNHLEEATVARLEAEQHPPVILFTDSYDIDGVEALTRTSQIFRYLLKNYELVERQQSFLVLQRNIEGKGHWQEQELPDMAGSYAPGDDHSLKLDFPSGSGSECRASDLINIQLRIAKTHTFGVRKPGELYLTLFLSNGEQRTQKLIMPPDGEPHEVLVSASSLSDPHFFSIFSPHRVWRASERITGLELKWNRLDRLSSKPSVIAIQHVSILRRAGVQVIETPLRQQDRTLWE